MNFFAELKRQNVYKVAIAYVVASWALAQGLAQVLPVFDIPNWVIRLVVLLLIIGFPVALVLSWAFEITPEGTKRADVADRAPMRRSHNRVWLYVVVVAGAISVSLLFLGRFTAVPKQSASANAAAQSASTIPEKSIAVLPFENLSHDPDNAYFADGIQEEILTRVAKIADVKVISRTSTPALQKHA